MAMAADTTGAVVSDQENRVTLRDPIRESEGLFFIFKNKNIMKFLFRTSKSSSY